MLVMEYLTSGTFFFLGLYLLSPWHTVLNGTPMFEFLSTPYVNLVYSFFYIVAGAVGFVACRINTIKWRSASTFVFFNMFFLIVMIRVLTVGFVPVVWVWPLLLGLCTAVANISQKWRHTDSDGD